MKRSLLTILAACAAITSILAIPTKPGPVKYTQPDGTVITVTFRGDEFGHMIFSEDGLLLKEKDGRLEYASFDSEGMPQASGIVADGTSLPESVARSLQNPSQIGEWAETLWQQRQERLSMRQNIYKEYSAIPSVATRSDSDTESDGKIGIDFGLNHSLFPAVGEPKALVILVEYKDLGFTYGSHEYYDRLLNEEGFSDYGSRGSVRDWLIENSGGRFSPHFDVYGPVTLPKERAYYGTDEWGTDRRAYMMAMHALKELDDDVDFSQYDTNGDGLIDNVYIIYAGLGSLDSNSVWPHTACMSEFNSKGYYFDGVRFEQYACASELMDNFERPDGIGTFVHEFSHVIGLPDIYGKGIYVMYCFHPGTWSTLADGPYNNDGLTPPNYSSFEKACLGWQEFLPLNEEGVVELPDFSMSGVAYAMPTDREHEFYFFENRQQVGNDEYLPGHGMLVWHVDFDENLWASREINDDYTHQHVDIVEADDIKTDETRDGDSFPGAAGVTEFGFSTSPSLSGWSGKQLGFDLTDIKESEDGVISFRVVNSNTHTSDPGSVGNIASDPDTPTGDMYDVLGRRILNPAPGQLYIQDGKKKVK